MPTASPSKRKRPGPAPRGPYEGKRRTLTTKITEGLRQKLDDAAERSNRSLSQEIEFRLDYSFRDQDARDRDFSDDFTLKLMRALATAKVLAEARWGKDAYKDAAAAGAAYDAMVGILDSVFHARAGGVQDETTPTEGQKLIIDDPNARSDGQNIRDVILESVWDGAGFTEPKFRQLLMEKQVK